jgi:hypothetical protein
MNAPQKKEKLVRVTTPAGFLSYPKLDKPGETKFDLGFYHADLFISAEDMGSDDGKNFQLKMIEVARKFTGHPTLTLRLPRFRGKISISRFTIPVSILLKNLQSSLM